MNMGHSGLSFCSGSMGSDETGIAAYEGRLGCLCEPTWEPSRGGYSWPPGPSDPLQSVLQPPKCTPIGCKPDPERATGEGLSSASPTSAKNHRACHSRHYGVYDAEMPVFFFKNQAAPVRMSSTYPDSAMPTTTSLASRIEKQARVHRLQFQSCSAGK
ncbi:hypothetical protein N657DRAFT_311300 [Parathielavia appendiculata]|uniref:Uncharacterized protein n=1 Tax=Parathielavia appendiculata TaxID=2587402 RepID=A0AAN6Z6Y9_9PEZI|nr:hypothetical protein N657DRAFT_311300 [Parathielavia appendiculata]